MVESLVESKKAPKLSFGVFFPEKFEAEIEQVLAKFAHEKIKAKFLIDSKYECAYCSFRHQDHRLFYMHQVDLNPLNLGASNFQIACGFCKACFHLGKSSENSGAKIVLWPELSQAQINRMIRGLFVAQRAEVEGSKELSQRVFKSLSKRAKIVKDTWGSANPKDFASALHKIGGANYEECTPKMVDLRMVVTPNNWFIKDHLELLNNESRSLLAKEKVKEELMYSLSLKAY